MRNLVRGSGGHRRPAGQQAQQRADKGRWTVGGNLGLPDGPARLGKDEQAQRRG
jgi:hypothetical protein